MLKCKGLFAVCSHHVQILSQQPDSLPKTLPGDQKSGKSLDKTPIKNLCWISSHPEPQTLIPQEPHNHLAGVSSFQHSVAKSPAPALITQLTQTVKWVCRLQIRDLLEDS